MNTRTKKIFLITFGLLKKLSWKLTLLGIFLIERTKLRYNQKFTNSKLILI